MSKLLEAAQAIGARYALIVKGENGYIRFYKPGTWETSRNCMLYWNEAYQSWDNSSELSFSNIELGMRWTNREICLCYHVVLGFMIWSYREHFVG